MHPQLIPKKQAAFQHYPSCMQVLLATSFSLGLYLAIPNDMQSFFSRQIRLSHICKAHLPQASQSLAIVRKTIQRGRRRGFSLHHMPAITDFG